MRWIAVPVLCSLACTGGQTGDESLLREPFVPPGTGASGNEVCPTRESGQILPSIDEASPDGFAAREVLAFAEGVHTTTLHFLTSLEGRASGAGAGDDELEIRPSAEDTSLTIELGYEGGEVRYFPPDTRPCQGRLQIDVRLSLRSADGALDETWQATLEARGRHEARVHVAARPAVRGETPPLPRSPAVSELHGALEVEAPERGNTYLAWLDAYLLWSAFGVQGSLSAWIRYGNGSAFLVEIATFGAHCEDRYGFAIDEAQALPNGLRPADALDRLSGLSATQALWPDGEADSLALSFAYAEDSACARLDDSVPGRAVGSLWFSGTLSLVSANGRLDADWPVSITATVASEADQPTLQLGLARDSGPRPDNLESDWGIRGVAAEAFDSLTLELDATLEVAEDVAGLRGEIVLIGSELPEIVPTDRPLSSADLRTTELLRLQLGGGAP